MDAIVSVLDDSHFTQVLELWDELEDACGLRGIKITPIPHFSWQVAGGYDFPALRPVVEALAAQIAPFTVHTTGLAMFTGPRPVLYVPVVRDARLSAVHAGIWQACQGVSDEANDYYHPDVWTPHITLAFGDFQVENAPCVMDLFLNRSFDWEIQVDNLAVVAQRPGQVGVLLYRLPLLGSEPRL